MSENYKGRGYLWFEQQQTLTQKEIEATTATMM